MAGDGQAAAPREMAKLNWLYFGIFFSIILFLVIYFLIYKRVVENPSAILMLGNKDVSGIGEFFSKIGNVIISSVIIGFFLSLTTLIRTKKNGV